MVIEHDVVDLHIAVDDPLLQEDRADTARLGGLLLLGERVLGLPKEPNQDKVLPFKELPKNG